MKDFVRMMVSVVHRKNLAVGMKNLVVGMKDFVRMRVSVVHMKNLVAGMKDFDARMKNLVHMKVLTGSTMEPVPRTTILKRFEELRMMGRSTMELNNRFQHFHRDQKLVLHSYFHDLFHSCFRGLLRSYFYGHFRSHFYDILHYFLRNLL